MSACTITISNGPVFTRTFIRDPYRKHLVNAVSNCFDSVLIHASDYSHDLLSRRTNIVMTAQTGTNILSCAYNARNEVTGVTIDTNAYTYSYDNIGNSLYTSLNTVTNAYTVNNLNQYKGITNLLDFTGYRLLHDSDGNTTRIDDHFLYYDDENRLSSFMFGNASMTGTVRSVYAYDHLARRVSKTQQERRAYDPGGMMPPTYWWHTNDVTTFVYDGWNLIHERVAHTNGTVDEIEYAWGLDLSGTRQGAGGVGGLLFEKRNGHIFIPCYDANGNITSYVDTNGTVRAYRQFDAFGNTVSKGGAMVDVFHFWYSAKYLDHDTGLYYYGYRYYSPMLQRWINRDPIGEDGGNNLYNFNENSTLDNVDLLGLALLKFNKKYTKGGRTRMEPERPIVKMKIERSYGACPKLVLESVTMDATIYQGWLLKLAHEERHVKDFENIAFNKTVQYAQSKEREYSSTEKARCWKHAAEEFAKLVFFEEAVYTTIVNVDLTQTDMLPWDLPKYKKQAQEALGMLGRYRIYLKNQEAKCNSFY